MNDKIPKGHGRIPHTAYTDAKEHQITIDDLKAGMPCPPIKERTFCLRLRPNIET